MNLAVNFRGKIASDVVKRKSTFYPGATTSLLKGGR